MENQNKIFYNHLLSSENKRDTMTELNYELIGMSIVCDDSELENYLSDEDSSI